MPEHRNISLSIQTKGLLRDEPNQAKGQLTQTDEQDQSSVRVREQQDHRKNEEEVSQEAEGKLHQED